jgi:hypothetical protein
MISPAPRRYFRAFRVLSRASSFQPFAIRSRTAAQFTAWRSRSVVDSHDRMLTGRRANGASLMLSRASSFQPPTIRSRTGAQFTAWRNRSSSACSAILLIWCWPNRRGEALALRPGRRLLSSGPCGPLVANGTDFIRGRLLHGHEHGNTVYEWTCLSGASANSVGAVPPEVGTLDCRATIRVRSARRATISGRGLRPPAGHSTRTA